MKRFIVVVFLLTMCLLGYSQDWFRFKDYKADNERVIADKAYPEVVFMGNSITENWAYYHPEFFAEHNYLGRGISGQTSAHMLVRFQSDVIDLHPRVVVIMAGTNDVAHNDFWADPEQVVHNVISMCTLAKANGIVPILSSIPPCNSFAWRKEIQNAGQTIADINAALKAYAKANDIVYVDYHSALVDDNLGFSKNLSNDGCHPNPDTYYQMEEMVVAAISKVLKTQQPPKANYDVVPQPKEVNLTEESPFMLVSNTVIYYEKGLQREAEFLSEYANEILGYMLETAPLGDQTDGIVLKVVPEEFDLEEAYEIDITPKQVVIKGADAAGVFHGIQTFRKSFPISTFHSPLSVSFPSGTIRDWPNFGYRGMHLDPCRHFIPLDSVKVYIDMLALHNMNQFHFHLSDDQGWRIEIKKYPELTEIGAYRNGTVIGHNGNLYDTIRHGGYYTQEELRGLIQYAAERHINIIPEIDLPGHMQAALACYPQLGCTGGPYEVWKRWGVSDDVLCAGNEETMLFVEDVLNEVMDLFPSPYIHIGGDECPKVRWEQCPKCQKKIQELGIKGDERFSAEDYLQSYVMNRMAKVVEARGRRVIGWDEILDGNVSETAIIMSWRGTQGGIEAARKGHDVIMAPSSHLYFDYYQSEDIASEPMCIGGYLPVSRVYEFQPLPAELTPEQQKHIIGVQANIWTEYIASFKHVQYMAMPRMDALAELQWNNPEDRDFDAFVNRCRHMAELYDLFHYNYATHIFNPQVWTDTVAANLATGKPISLRQQPAENYTYEGASLLNNGELGRAAYNSGRWLGFCGYPLDAVIDLETPSKMSQVRFHALTNKGAWIYNPRKVSVLVSDDGKRFRKIAQKEFPISRWDDKEGVFAYELEFEPIKARYFEIIIEGYDLPEDHSGYGHPAWIFVDEIEVN
ncbi:MAG: family 20 glycosylhydrolase [Bacteroidales bacterium]|nr:family 20 glycosylhydrolase [Bacteroidales bacterium]